MTKAQVQAKTILGILKKIEDQVIKNELVLLFTVPYVEHTREKVAGLKEEVLVEKILVFLKAVAEGEIVIADENQEFIANLPNLEELVDAFEEAQKRGFIEESQVKKALLRALLAEKRKEQLARLRKGGQDEETEKTFKIRPTPPRIIPPKTKEEVGEKKPVKETGGGRLLLRISYLNPQRSIVDTALGELSKIPLSIPGAAFGEAAPGLVSSGTSPQALEEGVKKFQEDNPGLEKHPAAQALLNQAKSLQDFLNTHPDIREKYNLLGETKVEIFLPAETGLAERGVGSTARLVGVSFEKDVQRNQKLILSPLKPEVAEAPLAAEPRTISRGFVKSISEAAKNALPLSAARLVNNILSFLGKIRPYLGGALIISSLALPLSVPLRAAVATFGFVLGREKFVAFLENVSLGLFKAVRGYSFSGALSNSFKNLISTIFTKPTLGWLRTTLAFGGIGSLFLPLPLPLRLVFAAFGGSLGLTQAAMSIGRWGGALSRISLGLSRGMLALSVGATAPVWGWIALAVAIAVAGIGIFSYLNIQGSQKLFLTSGATAGPQESRFIQITKSAAPQNLKNDELPKTVEFTIVVTAREQALTITSVKETFSALAKDKTITVPEKTLSPSKTRLAVGESAEIKFSLNFDKNFEDSAVTSTTVVSASVDGRPATETASASTTVIIGSPPTSCFEFTGNNWVEQERGLIMGAIAHATQASLFVSKICTQGRVELVRKNIDPGWSGEVPDRTKGVVYFYNGTFTSQEQAIYVFSHEIGHVYSNRNLGDLRSFKRVYDPNKPEEKRYLPTYPEDLAAGLPEDERISEDFAETIAIYIIWKRVPYLGKYNLADLIKTYPLHYGFAKETIFAGFEF